MSIQGERIKQLRTMLGITQTDLAKVCGYKTHTIIQLVEAGQRELNYSKLRLCARALGTTAAYLSGSTGVIERKKSDDIADQAYGIARQKSFEYFLEESVEEFSPVLCKLKTEDRNLLIRIAKQLASCEDYQKEFISASLEYSNNDKRIIEALTTVFKRSMKTRKRCN